MSSSYCNILSELLDLESISNCFYFLSIIDIPKFEQFSYIILLKINGSSPPNHTHLFKPDTGNSKMLIFMKFFPEVLDHFENPDNFTKDLE